MKDFVRDDLLFSVCGLNCGLCPMNLGGYCPGCGGGNGNQSCKIAACSFRHSCQDGRIEYCTQCKEFPCEKYEKIDERDSFISHRNRKKDLEKQRRIGRESYRQEQEEKVRILKYLLDHYNDGRKKSFYCLAVNLLELNDLKRVLYLAEQAEADGKLPDISQKEKAAYITAQLRNISDKNEIELKLRK